MTRKAERLADFDAVGRGKCDGWRALDAQPVPDGMVKVEESHAVAGFEGFKVRVATSKELKAIARAWHLRDLGIGVVPAVSGRRQ